MQIIKYILFSSVCLSILYLAFRLIYRNESKFQANADISHGLRYAVAFAASQQL